MIKFNALVWLATSCLMAQAAEENMPSTDDESPTAAIESTDAVASETRASETTNLIQSTVRSASTIGNATDGVVPVIDDPDSYPIQPISAIIGAKAFAGTNGQIHVRGFAIDQRVGESILVRDETGTIFAETPVSLTVQAEEEVEVWGKPAWDGSRVYLKNATVRSVKPKTRLVPDAPTVGGLPSELPLLTTAREVRDLSTEKASWKCPVRLRAIVTFYAPERWQFFVQDNTAGIYVCINTNLDVPNLKPGDLIEVEGVSNAGWFAPDIIPSKVTLVGTADLPVPRKATLFQLTTGEFDSQWVEAHGVIRSLSFTGGLLKLKLSDSDGTLFVNLPAESAPTNLVDAIVRVRGVCASRFNNRRQIIGVVVWAPSRDLVTVEEPGASDPLNLTTQPILSLTQFRSREVLQRRVKVSGIVTLAQSDQSFFMQDDNDGLQVFTSFKTGVKPGDRVDVAGYAALGDYGTVLRDAIFRVVSHGSMPRPKKVSAEQVLEPQLHGMWVQVDARLLNHNQAERVLTLQLGEATFEARYFGQGSLPENPPAGSLLHLSGIYRVVADETRTPNSFRLVLPSADEVDVVKRPSWWTLEHTMLTGGILALVFGATILWVLLLRRKIGEQTSNLQQSEQKFRSLVEQSLVGVYVIQDGRFAYVNPRQAAIYGYTADEMVNSVRVQDTVLPEDWPDVEEHLRRRLEGEVAAAHYTFRGQRLDGSVVFVEVLGSRTDYNGKPAVLGTALDVTERKQAEEELFNSRRMLRTMLDTIPQRVFWKDQNLVYVGCNKPFADDRGFSDPSELIGTTDSETVSAINADLYRADDIEVIQSGRPKLNYEEPQIRPDGGQGWVRTSKVPLRDKDGQVIGILGTYEDITERKRADAALAEASALLDAMLDNSPDHIYFKDRQSRFVRYSKSFTDLLKMPDGTVLRGKTDFDLFTEEHARPAFEDEQRIMATGQPLVAKLEKETQRDGRITWALTTKLPWRDTDGNIIGTFGISKDVTGLKQVENQLARERELFRALLDNLPDAIYFKDRESRFVQLGRSKLERSRQTVLARYRAENPDMDTKQLPVYLTDAEHFAQYIAGKTDFDVYPEERARSAFMDEQEIIRTGQPIIGKPESVKLLDGTTAWVLTTKMPWLDSEGNVIGTFGVSRDISALKEAEAQLETAHQRLLETSRLAGMAEVATDVLHNVGNVLNSVNVSCSLSMDRVRASKAASLAKVATLLQENKARLAEFFGTDPRGQQVPGYLSALAEHFCSEQVVLLRELEQLLKHVDHIKQIVAMQQSYAKVAGVVENLNPTNLIDDALHINAAALTRHDIRVSRDFKPTPAIQTERHKVLQILVNLIRNAKYAMDEAKRPDKLLTIKVGLEKDHVKIQVIDNGVGIPKENITRIFGHGFTTRRDGHGFGLHSSALAVKELGGSLNAHSDGPGTGATFTLLLPSKPPSAAPLPA